MRRIEVLAAVLGAVVAWPAAAPADPPPWAPAHGYRAKQQRHAGGQRPAGPVDYDPYGRELGIPAGTCYREVIGGLLGGAVGGVVGSRIGKGDGRLAATATGAVIGYLIGSAVGRSMDQVDQACVGQVLERAADQRTVAWVDPGDNARYEVTPVRTYRRSGRYCRDYELDAIIDGRPQTVTGSACRNDDGTWTRLD